MGSFNASCSASNISIGAGKKVAYIPLIKARYVSDGHGLPIPNHMLIQPHALLTPFCLPIFGEYNDYGSVENIVKNANTEAIEQFFNISIEAFIECATCGRNPHDHFGDLFKHFVKEKHRAVRSNHRVPFDGKYLENIGFIRLPIPGEAWYDYTYDLPYAIKLIPIFDPPYGDQPTHGHRIIGIGFEMYDSDGKIVYSCPYSDAKDELAKAYEHVANYYILSSPEDQWKIKLFTSMSGMFVHKDIWDYMSNVEHKAWGDKSIEKGFDELREDLIAYENNEPQYVIRTAEKLEKQREFHQLMVKVLGDAAGEFEPREPGVKYKCKRFLPEDPLCALLSDNYFARFFDNWEYMGNLYRGAIIDGGIKSHFKAFYNFYWEMYSTNRFFFPGMNGEQCGNTEASLRLARQTVKLLEGRQTEENE